MLTVTRLVFTCFLFAQSGLTITSMYTEDNVKLTDKLRSENPPPKLLNGKLVMDKGFSWDEYDRIRILLKAVSSDMTDHNLSMLIAGLASESYCITTSEGMNLTVGECCELILRQYLVAGLIVDIEIGGEEFTKVVGNYAKSKEFRAKLNRAPEFSSRSEFRLWLMTREDRTLRDLQIETCKFAQKAFLDQSRSSNRSERAPLGESSLTLSAEAEIAIRKEIEKQIERIKKVEGFVQPKWRFEDTFELLTVP